MTGAWHRRAFLASTACFVVACSARNDSSVDVAQLASDSDFVVDEPGLPDKSCTPETGIGRDDSADGPTAWRAFRRGHPYHHQGLVVGPRAADGSRTLIISEPPPGVCIDDIRAIDPSLGGARAYHWRMGYDGWVRDAVVRLGRVPDDSLTSLLVTIQDAVFGSAYGARVDSVGTNDVLTSTESLDLSVSALELRNWLVRGDESFTRTGSGAGENLPSLLAGRKYGEFFSVTPGLVLWIIPRHEDIGRYLGVARRWVVDGDLVLGAIANDEAVAVIARERRVGEEVLPPLRVETMRTVAGSGTDHLAQSYERNFVFAGAFASGRDWAPIYLSPVLIDDEYGSLLNITDQLLKSWSEHGTVRYVNFRYPNPYRYPFEAPLHEVLGADETTFNWNTKGAGYVSEMDGLRVYALNRTGALPVSYFAGKDQSKNEATGAAEERAYDYFASLNDPNLARVVQYAALYQLFREFDVRGRALPTDAPKAREALRDKTIALIETFSTLPDDLFETIDEPYRTEFISARDSVRAMQSVPDGHATELIADQLLSENDSASIRAASALVARLSADATTIQNDATVGDFMAFRAMSNANDIAHAMRQLLPDEAREIARKTFLAAAVRPSARWIHTAAVVQSSSGEDVTGGHNLDATVTRIRASSDLSPGEIRLIEEDGRKVLLANEADVDRLGGNVRQVAELVEEGDESSLSQLVGRLRERTPRPRLEAIPSVARTAERPGGERLLGYRSFPRELTSTERAAASAVGETGRPYVSVHRVGNGSFEVVIGPPPRVLRAGNSPSAVDAVVGQSVHARGERPLQLQLAGFSDDDARAFTADVEWRLRRGAGSDQDVVSILHEDEPGVVGRIRAASEDVRIEGARVTNIQEVGSATADGERTFIADLELKLRTARGEQSVAARLRIKIKAAAAEVMQLVQAAVDRVIARLGGGTTPELAALAIQNELRPLVGEVHVIFDASDIHIVAERPLDLTLIPALGAG